MNQRSRAAIKPNFTLKDISPQGIPIRFKEQLKDRCISRMKRNRYQLLEKLRGTCTVQEAIQGLVCEESKDIFNCNDAQSDMKSRRASTSESIDDLMINGELSLHDYQDIIRCLEEALEEEMRASDEQLQLEEMLQYEEACLSAAIQFMDSDEEKESSNDKDSMIHQLEICPNCKSHRLLESDGGRLVYCCCGFKISMKNDSMGLQYFQDMMGLCLEEHRKDCKQEPSLDIQNQFGDVDILYMTCSSCGYFSVVV